MTLRNLLRIGRLNAHTPDAAEIQRLLAAAERNLADAKVSAVSEETRFDAAYKAIMQAALVAMMASGFRLAGASSNLDLSGLDAVWRVTSIV